MSIVEVCAVSLAGAACLFDLKSARIPNKLTFAAAGLAIIFHAAAPEGQGAGAALAGLLAGLMVFMPIFALGAMGAGDVKLMAALGAWLGWQPAIFIALYGAVAGGVLAVLIASLQGFLGQTLRNIKALLAYWWVVGIKPLPALTLESKSAMRLPYALPIAAGLMVTLWTR
jgi:prepilin peptidase CpaA